MTETAEQNCYQRALEASFAVLDREQGSRGQSVFFEHNHRVLTEHAPAAGPAPQCSSSTCGKPWPCEDATTAMTQVGVRS